MKPNLRDRDRTHLLGFWFVLANSFFAIAVVIPSPNSMRRREAPPHTIWVFQCTKVWQHFCALKTKPIKGFKSTKWLRHFVLWYN
jgi:hypothetical protein